MKKKRNVRKAHKDHFSLKEEYVQSWKFIKESRNYIYAAIITFFIFAVIGFFFEDLVNYLFHVLFGMNLNSQIMLFIKELVQQTEGLSHGGVVGFIFFNNLQSSFFAMIFGLLLGIFPVISLISNGYVLGFVSFLGVKVGGLSVLWKLAPHGIFELPAIFLSIGLGLKLGSYLFRKNKKLSFWYYLHNSLRIFLLIIFPLLLVAALIEGTLIFIG